MSAGRVASPEALEVAAIAGREVPDVSVQRPSESESVTGNRPLSAWSGVSTASSLGPPAHQAIPRAQSWHTERQSLALDPVDEDAVNDAPSGLLSVPNDKASRFLGIQHSPHMEPIPASRRSSIAPSTRSTPAAATSTVTKDPLCALYLVSGLPKSPQTWTLADADATAGLHHTEGAVNRWWRPEVLGSTASPGASYLAPSKHFTNNVTGVGASRKALRKKQSIELLKGGGILSKQDIGKMLSKSLKVPIPLLLPCSSLLTLLSSSRLLARLRSWHPPSSHRRPCTPSRSACRK
jgi:hypothetical protein